MSKPMEERIDRQTADYVSNLMESFGLTENDCIRAMGLDDETADRVKKLL